MSYAPCPKCSNSGTERVKSTWWGGRLGPEALRTVRCTSCGHEYDGRTGRYNTINIVRYWFVMVRIYVLQVILMALYVFGGLLAILYVLDIFGLVSIDAIIGALKKRG